MSLSGSFTELALGDLLQVTAMQQRTCCIAIDDPLADGEIYFVSGELTHARFGELDGNEAVYALLAREQARFKMRPGVIIPVRTVFEGWQQLMMEGARRRDEGIITAPQASRRRSSIGALLDSSAEKPRSLRIALRVAAAITLLLAGAATAWLTHVPKVQVASQLGVVGLTDGEVALDAAELVGAQDSLPVLIESVPPWSPNIDLALSPTIICRVLVSSEGSVVEAKVYRSRLELAAFESAALAAVRGYRFKPAQRAGKPVSVWINVPVSFDRKALADRPTIQVKGSDTIGGELGPALARAFERQRSARVEVEALGSATAFVGLFDGSADIGASSRPIRPNELKRAEELGLELREFAIGYDGIAIVVHRDNPLNQITVEQASAVFQGTTRDWSELGGEAGPIRVVSRPSYSGTHSFFRDKVLRLGDANGPEDFGVTTEYVEKNDSIVEVLKEDPHAISYVGLGWVNADMKVLAVALGEGMPAVVPNAVSVRDGTYPVYRPLLMYTRGQPTGEVARLLRFIFSSVGQRIVEEHGFVGGDVAVDIPGGEPEHANEPHVVRIYFSTGRAGLDAGDRQLLDGIATEIKAGGKRVILAGCSDSVGDPTDNAALAGRRAAHVAQYLKSAGVAESLIHIEEGGDGRPIATNTSEDGRRANRRVDVYLVTEHSRSRRFPDVLSLDHQRFGE